MKVVAILLGLLFSISLISIKAAVAVAFLGTCTAICIWINMKVKISYKNNPRKIDITDINDNMKFESYDGNLDDYPLY